MGTVSLFLKNITRWVMQNCNNFIFFYRFSMPKLKSTARNVAHAVKKRGVLQTAWVIPEAQKVTSSPAKKQCLPVPPNPDEFLSPSQMPPHVEHPMEEAYTHNTNVIKRQIEGRIASKISNLSKVPDLDEDEYESSFIDDSEAAATTLTYVHTHTIVVWPCKHIHNYMHTHHTTQHTTHSQTCRTPEKHAFQTLGLAYRNDAAAAPVTLPTQPVLTYVAT